MRCTRTRLFTFVGILFALSCSVSAFAQTTPTVTFTSALSLGSSGPQVTALQKILNRDPVTLVSSTGLGSPGNETGYFGLLTQAAVIRFQNKYASKILAPAGLSQGNGYVGAYTRSVLNSLVTSPTNTTPVSAAPAHSITATPTVSQNPNQTNLDLYIAKIQKLGLTQGLSSSTIALITQKIRTEAATSTDFTQEFYNEQKALYEKKISDDTSHSPLLAFVEKAFSLVAEPFYIEKAYAAIGIPFGGYITYVNPAVCDCPPGVITQIFVALPNVVPPETSNLLLNYANGSEAFLNYNIPLPKIAVLGFYSPAAQACWTYSGVSCVPVPAEGLIINPTGSSLAP